MINKKILKRYSRPVYVENRNFQKDAPSIGKLLRLSNKVADSFVKNKLGVVANKRVVYQSNCLVCSSGNSKLLFIKKGFKYVECNYCEHVYVQNMLKEKILLNYYSDSHKEDLNIKVQKDKKRLLYWNKLYKKYINLYLDIKKNNRILDVGTGAGNFLRLCKKINKFELYGLDFSVNSKKYVEKIIGKKNFIFQIPIKNLSSQKMKPFGFITLWGVLEHLSNPIRDLRALSKITVSGGYCLALIPNLKSQAFKILGIATPTLSPTEHVSFFSLKSLNVMCKKTGFKLETIFCELPIIDLMYPYIDYNKKLENSILARKESYYWVCLFKKK